MENMLDKLIESDMFNFVIASLISADSVYTLEDANDAKSFMNKLDDALETSKLKSEYHERMIKETIKLINMIIKRDFNV